MRRVVIFGAGQCGRWLRRLLAGTDTEVAGFADNGPAAGLLDGLPVYPPEALPGLAWDAVIVAVKGKDRTGEILRQLSGMGLPMDRVETVPSFLMDLDLRCLELDLAARRIREKGIAGAAAELGVYRGDFAARINGALPDRTLYLFDTFEGFCGRDVTTERRENFSRAEAGDFGDTDVETVRSKLPLPGRAVFRKGIFPESAASLEDETFCLVSLDADLYAPTYEGLKYFYPRLSPGGVLLLHDYDSARFRGAGEAARRYASEQGLFIRPLWDMHGSAVLEKILLA